MSQQRVPTKRTHSGVSSSPSINSISRDLPPPRRSQALRSVPKPLENTSLRQLIYVLVILTTVLSAFYSYRLVQHKSAVGGWWNLALGRTPPQMQSQPDYSTGGPPPKGSGHGVEEKISELASIFGIPSTELASAIAVAVRNYVPPASLSSVAAKETGTIIDVLVNGDEEIEKAIPSSSPTSSPGVVEGIVEGMESFVGMDEP